MNKKINKNDKKFSTLMLLSYLWYDKITRSKKETLTKFDNYCLKKSIQFFEYLSHFVSVNQQALHERKLNLLKADILNDLPEADRKPASSIIDCIIAKQLRDGEHSNHQIEQINILKIGVDAYLGGLSRHLVSIQPLSGPVGLGFALQYTSKEDGMYLEVVSHSMEAVTRQLQSCWSMELLQDVKLTHNVDVYREIETAFAAEVSSEVDSYVMAQLLRNVGTIETVKLEPMSTVSNQDHPLLAAIYRVANEIACKTRRGFGNYIVASPTMVSMLQAATKTAFEPATSSDTTHVRVRNGNCFVGTLAGSIKVYCSLSIADGTILVGYKGSSEIDAGYILAPYVAIDRSAIAINPNTYQPVVQLKTRYGEKFNDGKIANGSDYYGVVLVDTTSLF